MTPRCRECGTLLDEGRSCEEYFHDLLMLEAHVPGAPGNLPHFFAVAAYNLQHPSRFTPAALVKLRRLLADVLAGQATLQQTRRRVSRATDGPTRVHRRPASDLTDAERETLRGWPTAWGMTVRDVCHAAPERYLSLVREWASDAAARLNDPQAIGEPPKAR